jgi:hypothetical protein
MAFGDLGRALAMASFIGCLALALTGRSFVVGKARRIGPYAWLNVVTLA